MERLRLAPAGIVLVLLLLCGVPRCCLAADSCQLMVYQDEEDLRFKLTGEFSVPLGERWRLRISATMPQPVTSENEESVRFALDWHGEGWQWTATVGYARATESKTILRLRGTFKRPFWTGAATVYQDGGELGVEGYIARSLGPHWRLSFSQSIADVQGQSDYRRYETEASAIWRDSGRSYRLALGGTAHQGEEAADDSRMLYGELACSLKLPANWSLNGELRLARQEEAMVAGMSTRLSLELARRAPVGLRLQAEYKGGSLRGGLTFQGAFGKFAWKAGLAGETDTAAGTWETWVFGTAGWRVNAWEIKLNLAPSGEYAVNSRHGYWMTVTYWF